MVLSKEDFKKKIDTLEISDDKKIEILDLQQLHQIAHALPAHDH